MPSTTLFTLKRRRSLTKYAGDLMDEEILKEFRGPFSRAVTNAYKRLVVDWSERPGFFTRVQKTSAGRYTWRVQVGPKDSLAAQRWLMVDILGREGGARIEATDRRGRLKVREYIPKTLPRTKPRGGYSPSARTGGPPSVNLGGGTYKIKGARFPNIVYQGKVEPRGFTEKVIKPSAEEEFKNANRRAYQRVAYRFNRE